MSSVRLIVVKQSGFCNIDAGCVFKKYGFLVALNLTENKFIAVKNIDL